MGVDKFASTTIDKVRIGGTPGTEATEDLEVVGNVTIGGDLEMTGGISSPSQTVGSASAVGSLLALKGDEEFARGIVFQDSAGNTHIGIYASGDVTGVSDAGDKLEIKMFEDDGTLIGNVIEFFRAAGLSIYISRPVNLNGYALTAGNVTGTGVLTMGSGPNVLTNAAGLLDGAKLQAATVPASALAGPARWSAYVPAAAMVGPANTYATLLVLNSSYCQPPQHTLANGSTVGVHGTLAMPDGYAGQDLTVEIYWATAAAGTSGDVKFQVRFATLKDDDSGDFTGTVQYLIDTFTAQKDIQSISGTLTPYSAAANDKLLSFVVGRVGGAAEDTFDSDVYLLGVRFSW